MNIKVKQTELQQCGFLAVDKNEAAMYDKILNILILKWKDQNAFIRLFGKEQVNLNMPFHDYYSHSHESSRQSN